MLKTSRNPDTKKTNGVDYVSDNVQCLDFKHAHEFQARRLRNGRGRQE